MIVLFPVHTHPTHYLVPMLRYIVIKSRAAQSYFVVSVEKLEIVRRICAKCRCQAPVEQGVYCFTR